MGSTMRSSVFTNRFIGNGCSGGVSLELMGVSFRREPEVALVEEGPCVFDGGRDTLPILL